MYDNSAGDAGFLVSQALARRNADAAGQVLLGRNGFANSAAGFVYPVPQPNQR